MPSRRIPELDDPDRARPAHPLPVGASPLELVPPLPPIPTSIALGVPGADEPAFYVRDHIVEALLEQLRAHRALNHRRDVLIAVLIGVCWGACLSLVVDHPTWLAWCIASACIAVLLESLDRSRAHRRIEDGLVHRLHPTGGAPTLFLQHRPSKPRGSAEPPDPLS